MFSNYTKKSTVSVMLKTLFVSLHCLCGLDFGFSVGNTSTSKLVAKVYTIVFSCFVCLINLSIQNFFAIEDALQLVWITFVTAQYIITSLFLTFNQERSFYTFTKVLHAIDSKLDCDRKVLSKDPMIVVSIIITSACKLLITNAYCIYNRKACTTSILLYVLILIQLLTCEIAFTVMFHVYYLVYCRLKRLNHIVTRTKYTYRNHIAIYKSIADILDFVRRTFDFLFIFFILIKTPELILIIFLNLRNIRNGQIHIDAHAVAIFYSTFIYIIISAPAISAGLVSSEVNKMKLALHDKLLYETDDDQKIVLKEFIDYVRKRPLKIILIKFITLDWTFPLSILNLCISYQIIVVQLTHLF